MKSAFQEFNQINGRIENVYHEAAVKMGLPDSEFWILYTLRVHEDSCLQTVLCRETGMTKSTVNSALKKMEKEELLLMCPGGGRNTRIRLTEQGISLAERTVDRLIEMENCIYTGWTGEEQELLMKLNREFLEQMEMQIKKYQG